MNLAGKKKVEIEELEGNINILTSELKKHKNQNTSFQKRLSRYKALKDITESFSASLSLDDTIDFIIKHAHLLITKANRTLFYLLDTKTQELALKSAKQNSLSPIRNKKGDVFDRFVLRTKRPLSILDADKDFRFDQEQVCQRESSFKSLIVHPLISGKKVLGLIHMDSPDVDKFSPDDLRLLGIVSNLGAVALENAMLYERTQELAIRDDLTNLFVHRYFKERLDSELQRANLGGYDLSLLMADLDHFKIYNDKYGHTAGDILLKGLSDIFNKTIAAGDLISRYGGEEFAILLIEKDKGEAFEKAEEIKKRVEKNIFWLRREKTQITVSIGVSSFPSDAKTKNEFIEIADKNLYRAKKEGRNRVC